MPNENTLIDHWSYSSLKDFLSNPYKFLQVWVLKTWAFKSSPMMVAGKAGHKALEHILKGGTHEQGIEQGLRHIAEVKDSDVRWGETGSREEVIRLYTQGINFYLAEMPDFGKILSIEETFLEFVRVWDGMTDDPNVGDLLPVPFKFVGDVLSEVNGDLVLWDHKFVKSYTKSESDRADRILQAIIGFHVVRAKYGRNPVKMVYPECKVSLNSRERAGEPQIQNWEFVYAAPESQVYFAVFYKLIDAATRQIMNEDYLFLPNLTDFMDGEETLKMFAAETVGIDRPVAVQHKTAEVEFVDRKHVPSAADRADNVNLGEEEKIRLKLQEFGLRASMATTTVGHNVIQYTLKPSRGERMAKYDDLAKDIALATQALTVRIQAPIPGTSLVGIEIPNPRRTFAKLPDEMEPWTDTPNKLVIPMGLDVYGKVALKDLRDMPHLLVAGATGSGKSMFLHVAIKALMMQNGPEHLRLVLIDPKRVEFSRYKGDPHLEAPPIFEVTEARNALEWLVTLMEKRYDKLERAGSRDIDEYIAAHGPMSRFVCVIDEFADLMLQAKHEKKSRGRKTQVVETKKRGVKITTRESEGEQPESEELIVRLAQKGRAAGIHLILGTQRPSVDVVTGVLKANLPTRVACSVATQADSRVILDRDGAETLLGKGDLLFMDPARRDLVRLQSFHV